MFKLMQSKLFMVLPIMLTSILSTPTVFSTDWSTTELHYQYGNLRKAYQGGGSASETGGTSVLTLQHNSGWKYGDNFFFFDHSNYGKTDVDSLNGDSAGDEIYGEFYSNFSLGKITGKDIKFGPINDIGLVAGFNFAPEIETLYYMPGVRLAFDLPGFNFAQLDITGRIQDSSTKQSIKEKDTYMLDFSWAYPFAIDNTRWSLEGHIEYMHRAKQSIRGVSIDDRKAWWLSQIQLRFDIGHLWGNADKVFVGIEHQYWRNKQGDPNTTENVPQLLLVWRL